LKLARPPATITVADIVEAVEGPIALTACSDSGKNDCTLTGACLVRPHWPLVNEALRGALASVPLTRLAGVAPVPKGSAHIPPVAATPAEPVLIEYSA
jgi:DNA-binding IscR family transcriptional regulator